jgi:hypothetical protein
MGFIVPKTGIFDERLGKGQKAPPAAAGQGAITLPIRFAHAQDPPYAAVRSLLTVLGLLVGTVKPKASARRWACWADFSKALCIALGDSISRLG